MKFTSLLKNRMTSLLCAGLLAVVAAPMAMATDLPPGVLNYLRTKDPHVKVRFDGVVLFSNGESYVPVIPQDPSLKADSQQVIATVPDKVPYPDLIQFDNNFFLMRLIQTASGRMTFPKLADYPIQLKEGLLPQDFVLPSNLYIPVELKIILGALPYNPHYTPSDAPVLTPASVVLRNAAPPDGATSVAARVTYVFDLEGQKILSIDPITGQTQGEVAVDCVPSNMQVSPDGKLLFVPCLSTNELVVVDTGSNLIKTRIPVGQRPDAILYYSRAQDVVVSNRYSQFLSVINSTELTEAQQVTLPGNGGAMAIIPGSGAPKLVVADAFNSQLYVVDLNTLAVERTFKALPDISAVEVFQDPKGRLEIWVASRTKAQVMVLDGVTGTILKTLDVGDKPVDMAAYQDKLLVVSAGDDRIDVINRADQSKYTTIPVETDGFPSSVVLAPSENRAYVTLAAAHKLVVLNLASWQVESTIPVSFRADMMAMTPDKLTLERGDSAIATPPGLGLPTSAVAPMQEQAAQPASSQPKDSSRKKAVKPVSKTSHAASGANDVGQNTTEPATLPHSNSFQQPLSQQSLPGQANGKFQLKLGLGKAKAKTPTSDAMLPAQVESQMGAPGNVKQIAAPPDLQVADPSPVSSPQVAPASTQSDIIK